MAISVAISKFGNGVMELNVSSTESFPNNKLLPHPRTLSFPFRCHQAESAVLCEPCSGKGWLICDFCKGQKTNVKGENNRLYRRCPSCRAIGYVLCSKCKVFKCVTFPDSDDGVDLIL